MLLAWQWIPTLPCLLELPPHIWHSFQLKAFHFLPCCTFGHCRDQLNQPIKCTVVYISSVHMPLYTKKPRRPQWPMSRNTKLFATLCRFSEWCISNKWCQTSPLLMLALMGCVLLFTSSVPDLCDIFKATQTTFIPLVKGFVNLTLSIPWW
jgi:hypothetical protein